MQVAVLADHLGARAQPEVEGIAQDDLRTNGLNVARQHALDRAIGTDRHEGRGFYHPTRKGQTPAAGLAIGGKQFKGHVAHDDTSGPVGAGLRVMNMASP